jgi:hypothetical protein
MTIQSRLTLLVGCFVSLCLMFGVFAIAQAGSFPTVGGLASGDLVTSPETQAVYYFGEDERRYVFPTEGIYFSWYENFETVETVEHADLMLIPLGGNVTYRPYYAGIPTRLVKKDFDPDVYVVFPDAYLLPIDNEETAEHFFGAYWANMVEGVSDAFIRDYGTYGGYLNMDMEFAPLDHALTINSDKGLGAPVGFMMNEAPLRFGIADQEVDRYGTIKFVNDTNEVLTIREDRGHWTTGPMAPGDVVVIYIDDTAGLYSFTADEDSSMTGTLTVR